MALGVAVVRGVAHDLVTRAPQHHERATPDPGADAVHLDQAHGVALDPVVVAEHDERADLAPGREAVPGRPVPLDPDVRGPDGDRGPDRGLNPVVFDERVRRVSLYVYSVEQRVHGQPAHVVAGCIHKGHRVTVELLNRAVLDPHAVEAGVLDPVARTERNLAVDGVAVQVQPNVVRADPDPVAGTLRDVAVQDRVGRDRLAAAHVASECARRQQAQRGDNNGGGDEGGSRDEWSLPPRPRVGNPKASPRRRSGREEDTLFCKHGHECRS
jgi:hypothetical protein